MGIYELENRKVDNERGNNKEAKDPIRRTAKYRIFEEASEHWNRKVDNERGNSKQA